MRFCLQCQWESKSGSVEFASVPADQHRIGRLPEWRQLDLARHPVSRHCAAERQPSTGRELGHGGIRIWRFKWANTAESPKQFAGSDHAVGRSTLFRTAEE